MTPSIGAPEPLTPAAKLRYADGIVDEARGRLITVLEDHTSGGEAVNSIAAICAHLCSPCIHACTDLVSHPCACVYNKAQTMCCMLDNCNAHAP